MLKYKILNNNYDISKINYVKFSKPLQKEEGEIEVSTQFKKLYKFHLKGELYNKTLNFISKNRYFKLLIGNKIYINTFNLLNKYSIKKFKINNKEVYSLRLYFKNNLFVDLLFYNKNIIEANLKILNIKN